MSGFGMLNVLLLGEIPHHYHVRMSMFGILNMPRLGEILPHHHKLLLHHWGKIPHKLRNLCVQNHCHRIPMCRQNCPTKPVPFATRHHQSLYVAMPSWSTFPGMPTPLVPVGAVSRSSGNPPDSPLIVMFAAMGIFQKTPLSGPLASGTCSKKLPRTCLWNALTT